MALGSLSNQENCNVLLGIARESKHNTVQCRTWVSHIILHSGCEWANKQTSPSSCPHTAKPCRNLLVLIFHKKQSSLNNHNETVLIHLMPPSHPRPTEEPTLPQKVVCHHDSKTFQHFPKLWSISLLHKHKKTHSASEWASSLFTFESGLLWTHLLMSTVYKRVHRAKGRKHSSFRKSHPVMLTLITWQPNWFMGVSTGGTICAYF